MRALLLLTAMAVSAPALADTKEGVDAWLRGDYKTAVDEWRKEAVKGDAEAQFNLGQAYKLGRGVPQDTKRAEEYYRAAAAKGHEVAADYYGLALFQNGKAREAVPYLEKSAARGEPRAQYLLGTMLFNGTDVPRDWVRAYALMTRARTSGLPQASESIAQMDRFIPADQRGQGSAMAANLAGPPQRGATVGEAPPVAVASTPSAPPAPPSAQPPLRPAAAPRPAPRPPVRPVPPIVAASGDWRLQLGAFGDPGNARRLGGQLSGRFPGRGVDYVKAGAMTRVLIGPFASRADAQAACRGISPCVPVTR